MSLGSKHNFQNKNTQKRKGNGKEVAWYYQTRDFDLHRINSSNLYYKKNDLKYVSADTPLLKND